MFEYFRRVVPWFSRGAPASAFLGPPSDFVYPLYAGYGQKRQFHVHNPAGANPDYSRRMAGFVDPTDGRFHSDLSSETSPLIPGYVYGIPPQTYADDFTGD